MKKCNKCKELKNLEDFSVSRASKDGRQGRCKECSKGLSLLNNLSPKARENERKRKRQYKKDHPEIVAAINRRTYAQRKGISIECTPAEVRQFMLDNPICARCGSKENLTLDHIIPVSWGILSRHALDNFQVLCNDCNALKGDRSSIDFRMFTEC